MKRKLSIMCAFFVMTLCLPMWAYAGELPTVTFDGSKEMKYSYCDTTNFGDGFVNMLPGEERTQDIILKNTSSRAVDFYMKTEALRTFEEFNQTAGAAYHVTLTITDGNGTTTIYGGTEEDGSNRIGADEEGLGNLNGNVNEWYKVALLNGGEEAVITLKVSLDGESHDNSYMAAEGTFQFEFKAGYEDKENVITTVKQLEDVVVNEIVYVIKSVKTGDESQLYLWACGIGICGILLMTLIVLRKKGRKQEK